MMHRFLTLSQTPEIRSEPRAPEAGVTEYEILIPVEVYWQLEEIIQEMKFLKNSGYSTSKLNAKLVRAVKPYLVNERDRLALSKTNPAA